MEPRSPVLVCRVLTLAMLLLGLIPGPGLARAEPERPAGPAPAGPAPRIGRPGPAVHIRVRGDLDSMSCVAAITARLDQARDAGASILILELGADRARPDVLLALAAAVREAEIPAIAYLTDDRDRRVTTPALAAALLIGDRVAIHPRTTLRFERGDWHEGLLPDDLSGDDAIEALRRAVQETLASREIDPTLSNAWLPRADAPPAPPVEQRILPRLGIDVIHAESATQILRAAGHRGLTPRAESFESGLEPARAEVARLIVHADESIAETRRALNLRQQRPDDREITVHDHRRAGNASLDRLALAAHAVDRAEELLREYPELLLAPPPGRTDVGATRTTLRNAWRYRIDDLRRDIEHWRQRAKDHASR